MKRPLAVHSESIRVSLPFNTAIYEDLNGWHPLFAPLYAEKSHIRFVEAAVRKPPAEAVERAREASKALLAYLGRETASNRFVGLEDICEFVLTRDTESQAIIPNDVDLVFHHTAPLTFGQAPWVLHIEVAATLFHPFLLHGRLSGLKLREQAVYWLVRALLERDELKMICTHMEMTVREIARVFDSDIISSKVRYIPPGLSFKEQEKKRIDRSMSFKHEASHPVKILYTNSWHRQPVNFFNRGGQEVIDAFIRLHRQAPDTSLKLLTTFPEDFRHTGLFREALAHPAIEVIERRVTDSELFDLYEEASIFLLPSAGLHSVSLLRAMGCGAVPVVSDAPGFSEFVEDGRNGVVVTGIKDRVYSIDDESGFCLDDYKPMRTLDSDTADSLVKVLSTLCSRPDLRKKLALNAVDDVRRRYDGEGFRRALETVFSEVSGPRQPMRSTGSAMVFFETRTAVPDLERVDKKDDERVRLVARTNGYNIIRAGTTFFAVARVLGRVERLKERFGECEAPPVVLTGGSERELRRRLASPSMILWKLAWGAAALLRRVSGRLRGRRGKTAQSGIYTQRHK